MQADKDSVGVFEVLTLILIVIAALAGCGNSAQNKSNIAANSAKQEQAQKDKEPEVKNPFSETPSAIRDIQANPKNYIGKTVVLGPLKILQHDVSNGTFRVALSKGNGLKDYDGDVYIIIGYNNLSEKDKWRDLSSESRPIIYAKGKIVEVSGSREVGLLASEIVLIGNSSIHADIKKDMEQVVKGN